MRDGGLGHALEKFAREMAGGAGAGGSIGERARLIARQRDQLFCRLDRQRRMNYQQSIGPHDERNRSEIADRIVWQPAEERGIDGVRADRSHHQRIAVGGTFRDDVGADIAAGARTVVNDHLLAP
ncbi:hypothetical protein D3C83_20350 [compost metagenome]